MDSTVERAYSSDLNVPTFSDDVLRQLIREFRENDFSVYLTLAFESHEARVSQRPVNAALARLMERGIIEDDVPGLFFLSSRVARSRRYPAIDGKSVDDVRLRVMRILFEDDVNSDGVPGPVGSSHTQRRHTIRDASVHGPLHSGADPNCLLNDTAPAGHTGR